MGGMYHPVMKYGVTKIHIKKISKKSGQDEKDIKKMLDKIFHEAHRQILKDLTKWIRKYVPKMTGRLRHDLWKHLLDSYTKNQTLWVYIATSIDYAEKVNNYQTHNVRHKGKRVKRRGKVYILWDPQAIGGFFDKMVIFAIKNIDMNLDKAKKRFSSRLGVKYRDITITKLR